MLMIALAALPTTIVAAADTADYNVVPLPKQIVETKGKPFLLDGNVKIVYPSGNDDMARNAQFLADYVRQQTSLSLAITTSKAKKSIVLAIDSKLKNDEGYRIQVAEKRVTISGRTPRGVFYGIQTLRKSLADCTGAASLPAVVITDEPRFAYRGMHLDVARHFFPVEFVKRYIDMMALHNMNTFHWHLTEDQGWRLEIKKYPLLTSVGSIRKQTVVGRNSGIYDGTPYGGFFTQEEAREVVKYAAERYITVIPEIDMPGHMLGALTAYPELGCTGGPYEVEGRWGVFPDILCAGKETTFDFLRNVLDEVMDIFPSQFIHIGGDEAPRTRWKECPKCQQRIREQGIVGDAEHSAEAKLQSYFAERVEKYLNDHGRRIIGWDELLEGEVRESATIMSWRGKKGGQKAAELGHDVIMTPNDYCYFDYYQTDKHWNEPLLIGGNLPLEKVYSLDPTEGISPENQHHILGAQANVWTEYIGCTQLVEYQAMPRAAALAEVQWVETQKKNFGQFKEQRLPRLLKLYDLQGYTYFKGR